MKARQTEESGFTLIELMVTVAIIGVLAAIAIPQFTSYRARGFDARAVSDLASAATAEEAYYAAELAYLSCVDDACTDHGGGDGLPGFRRSSGVSISMVANPGPPESCTGTASHSKGTGKVYQWDSAGGGLQQ